MAMGMSNAATKVAVCFERLAQITPTSRFQPKCRLGTAAYLLTSPGGCNTRYDSDRKVTVSR